VINRHASRRLAPTLLCSGAEHESRKVETGFFQDACGCGIVGKDLRRDSRKWKIVEAEISDRDYHFSHDARSQNCSHQPVTHCRCMLIHVLARVNTDRADGRAVPSRYKTSFPAVRLWLAGRIRVRLGSCTDRESIVYSQILRLFAWLAIDWYHRAATGVPCIVRARAGSILLAIELDTRFCTSR